MWRKKGEGNEKRRKEKEGNGRKRRKKTPPLKLTNLCTDIGLHVIKFVTVN